MYLRHNPHGVICCGATHFNPYMYSRPLPPQPSRPPHFNPPENPGDSRINDSSYPARHLLIHDRRLITRPRIVIHIEGFVRRTRHLECGPQNNTDLQDVQRGATTRGAYEYTARLARNPRCDAANINIWKTEAPWLCVHHRRRREQQQCDHANGH